MKRLSALDAAFLYLETPDTPMHIGSVTVFAPADDPDTLFDRFREHTRARIPVLPSYTRRLKATPLDVDHPVWVRDEPDLDWHLRHCALPSPGTMQQLREEVARLHAIPLDRTRPLWQYTLIEGLEDGGFAVFAKVHHSAMDGVAGLATVGVLYDFSPDAGAKPPRPATTPDETPADFLELTSTAAAGFLRQIGRAIAAAPNLATTLAKIFPHLQRDARVLLSYAKGAPQTRLNAPIRRERAFGASSVPLGEVKALAKETGTTINDIVLALSSGALRRWLSEHGDLPQQPLVAAVPASLREKGDWRLNNQVMFTFAHLPTNLDAPRARLLAAREAMHESKEMFAEVKDVLTTDFSAPGAPIVTAALARLSGSRLTSRFPTFFNIVISNVPGPTTPLYCAGSPASHYFPVSIPYHNCALNITVQSYCDTLDFGLTACAKNVPDVQTLADYIVEEFAALTEKPKAAPKKHAARKAKAPAPRKRAATAGKANGAVADGA
jgi:diacylglycerol O-acyltransferase / wax synthase